MSSRIARLIQNYGRHVALPWPNGLSGAQKVWFAVYDKGDERRLRNRIGEFELVTKQAGHGWSLCDVTDAFPRWMAGHEYHDSYFAQPELLESALDDFKTTAIQEIKSTLLSASPFDVTALLGVSGFFGFARVAEIINGIHQAIPGRLLVFFPGEYENSTYRLLDARDGWNYMAVPITSHEGTLAP